MWETYEDVIVADGADRVLNYYNNTMSTVGVSPLRVSDSDEVPETGVLVALAADDSDEGYFFAVDSGLGVFYPVLCTYSDGNAAKMFLAADPNAGLQMLQSLDLEYSVTGGKAGNCYVMPLLMGQYENGYDSYDDPSSSDDALEFDWGDGEEAQE